MTDKKWDYTIISDDTESVFKNFNQIYAKNREAARYYIINRKISSLRYVSFIDKNIRIIVCEQVSYGVSVTLKRYKSTKTLEKYYLDTKNGSISKSVKGKFIPCKPADISAEIRDYIISQIKWISFVFKLNLPVTFTTIVTKKLYSERKLLSFFWGTNYQTALKLHSYFKANGGDYIYNIRTNLKNIRNLNNIRLVENWMEFFIPALSLAVKTRKIINAAWSKKRLISETKKMNRIVLDTLYENYNTTLNIDKMFFPHFNYIKSFGYYIPETSIELSKICNSSDKVEQYKLLISSDKCIVIKKNNLILTLKFGDKYNYSGKKTENIFHIYDTYHIYGGWIQSDSDEKEDFLDKLNRYYILYLKAEERKNKLKKIQREVIDAEI